MTTTTNKGYTVPTVGGDFGTWGTELNGDLGIIDNNLGGVVSVNAAGNSNITASAAQAQNLVTILTGVLTGNIQYILPATGGMYIIQNSTTGAFTVTIASSGGGSTVVLPQATILTFVCDATNIALANQGFLQTGAAGSLASLTTTGNITAAGTVQGTTITATTALVSSALNGSGGSLSVTSTNINFVATNFSLNSAPIATQAYAAAGDTAVLASVSANFLALSGGTVTFVNTNGGNAASGSGWGFENSGGLGTYGITGATIGIVAGGSGILSGFGFFVQSDVRLKFDIETIEGVVAIEWLDRSRPVSFMKRPTWDAPDEAAIPEAGFIAQEQIRAGAERYVSFTDCEGMPELREEDGLVSMAGKAMSLPDGYQIAFLTAALKYERGQRLGLMARIEALESGYVK